MLLPETRERSIQRSISLSELLLWTGEAAPPPVVISTHRLFGRDAAVVVSSDFSFLFCGLIQSRRWDEEPLVQHQITMSFNLQIQTTI